jgi:hypothetical protein
MTPRELAMTLASEICGTLARGRIRTLTTAELDLLLEDCSTLNSLMGDVSDETISDLMERVRRLKDDANNPYLLDEALGSADRAKALTYEMPLTRPPSP